MTQLNPYIGLSPFSRSFKDQLGEDHDNLEQLRALLPQIADRLGMQVPIPPTRGGKIQATLGGSMIAWQISPAHRAYKYVWNQAHIIGPANEIQYAVLPGGQSSHVGGDPFGFAAYNRWELTRANIVEPGGGQPIYGFGLHTANFPDVTFNQQPVKATLPVEIQFINVEGIGVVPVFEAPYVIEPNCGTGTPPEDMGSCCTGSDCTQTTQANCASGDWTLNQPCSPNPCAPVDPLGSCCTGSSCSQTTQAACLSGDWTLGQPCTPNPCAPVDPLGRCCHCGGGACTDTIQANCDTSMGCNTWSPGISCQSNPCGFFPCGVECP